MISWTASGSPGARKLYGAECGAISDLPPSGWCGEIDRADDGEPVRIVIYCPSCRQRLFAEPGAGS